MTRVRVLTEDISDLNLTGHPQEIDITSFGSRPVSEIPPAAFAPITIADIERAIVDKGWHSGVRTCTVTVTRIEEGNRAFTRMKARLMYG